MTVQATLAATPEVIAANERFRKAAVADRRRLRLADTSEPITWQESHAPTEAVMVKVSTRVEVCDGLVTRHVVNRERCRRRKTESQLIESLDADQLAAVEAIYEGWCYANGRVSAGVARYGARVDPGMDTAETMANRRVRLETQYHVWKRQCLVEAVELNPIIQIIIYGRSVHDVNRDRKESRGKLAATWAKENLCAGLAVYVDLFIRRGRRAQ